MRIQHNIAALNTNRNLTSNNSKIGKTLEKLSSGYKINRAGDDAAGLAISEKMRGQIRGLEMAGKNTQDGISLIQTTEGALNEVHSILQRQRELMVQAANDTNTAEDKQKIQQEVKSLLEEIDNISETTNFNGIALLAGGGTIPPGGGTGGGTGTFAGLPPEPTVDSAIANQLVLNPNATLHEKIVTMLKASALSEGVKRIADYYGLTLSGEPMNVNIYNNPGGGALASVSYYYDTDGTGKGLNLNINESYFNEMSYPDGGTYPQYFDRVMTHELAHAVMAATTNFRSMPKWFKEGTAEFINGADERLAIDLAINGKNDLIVAIGDGTDRYWGNSSLEYSTGYLATKYLHDKLKKIPGGTGVKDVLTYMQADTTRTFEDALINVAGYNSLTDFVSDFKQNSGTFLDGLNLTNADVGAIGGADADGGSVLDARNVISDTLGDPNDPTNGAFNLVWPSGLENTFAQATITTPYVTTQTYNVDFSLTHLAEVKIHVGANEGQSVGLKLATVNTTQLAIDSINAELRPDSSITKLDAAIQSVSRIRSYFGAMQNRLEHSYESTMNTAENLTAAESRIRDTDMAKEMMNFTKQNILIQAAQSMLTQANQQPQGVLQLLN